jgi:hypothetical protein
VQRQWVVPGKTALRTVAAKHWRGIWIVKMTPDDGILAAQ